MKSGDMYSGIISYTKEFVDYEKSYLEYSFQACSNIGSCAGQEPEFSRILLQLQKTRQLNSGEYLSWVADFLGGIRKSGEPIFLLLPKLVLFCPVLLFLGQNK